LGKFLEKPTADSRLLLEPVRDQPSAIGKAGTTRSIFTQPLAGESEAEC
jgi:hypothetical protein